MVLWDKRVEERIQGKTVKRFLTLTRTHHKPNSNQTQINPNPNPNHNPHQATCRPVKDRWFYETIGISKTERATKVCTKETTPWETLPWGRIAQLYEHVDDEHGDWTLEQPVWCSYRPPGWRVYRDKKIQAAWLPYRLDQPSGCKCAKPHNIVQL